MLNEVSPEKVTKFDNTELWKCRAEKSAQRSNQPQNEVAMPCLEVEFEVQITEPAELRVKVIPPEVCGTGSGG